MYPYQIQGSRITIVVNNRPWTLAEGQPGYNELRQAIKDKNWKVVPDLVSPKQVIISYTNGSNVTIQDGVLCYKGVEVGDGITNRVMSMKEEGFDITPMVNYLERVMLNPSEGSRKELFQFTDSNDLPITEDGYFLAYKKVRKDGMDVFSGTVRNEVGDKPSMPRENVDDDRRNECSRGLHFCSYSYLNHFGGERVMILKIDPADVVSIPNDYNRAKGRCWRYEVVGEVPTGQGNILSNGPVVAASSTPVADYVEKAVDASGDLETVLNQLSQRQLHDLVCEVDSNQTFFTPKADGRIRNKEKTIETLIANFKEKDIRKALKSL